MKYIIYGILLGFMAIPVHATGVNYSVTWNYDLTAYPGTVFEGECRVNDELIDSFNTSQLTHSGVFGASHGDRLTCKVRSAYAGITSAYGPTASYTVLIVLPAPEVVRLNVIVDPIN